MTNLVIWLSYNTAKLKPSRGGLEVERSLHKRRDSASVGSNPIQVWCINHSETEMSCCKFPIAEHRVPLGVYDICLGC